MITKIELVRHSAIRAEELSGFLVGYRHRIRLIVRCNVRSGSMANGRDRIGKQLEWIEHGDRAGKQESRPSDARPEAYAAIYRTGLG